MRIIAAALVLALTGCKSAPKPPIAEPVQSTVEPTTCPAYSQCIGVNNGVMIQTNSDVAPMQYHHGGISIDCDGSISVTGDNQVVESTDKGYFVNGRRIFPDKPCKVTR